MLILIALTIVGCKSEKTWSEKPWSELNEEDIKEMVIDIQKHEMDSIKTSSHYEIWQDSVYGK